MADWIWVSWLAAGLVSARFTYATAIRWTLWLFDGELPPDCRRWWLIASLLVLAAGPLGVIPTLRTFEREYWTLL